MNQPPQEKPKSLDYLTIFLVSAAVMLYQITLTRILSVVVWYHFAFLTISLVMLGLGVPGVWFALTRKPLRFLPGLLLASGITLPLSVVLITKFGAEMLDQSIIYIVLCVLPATLSLGGVVCLILIKASGPLISRMYGVDLLGAGLGAAIIIPLMHVVPTPLIAAACGLLPLLCLVFYRGTWGKLGLVGSAVVVALLVNGHALRVTHSKSYDESKVVPIYEKWSPTARLTVFDETFFYLDRHKGGFSWGRGSEYPNDLSVRQYWLEQDGSAGTPITEFKGDLSTVSFLNFDVTTAGYQFRPPGKVAVIGAGGGRDILSALHNGASEVDAVELNRHTIDTVSKRFGDHSGDVYHLPGVNAVANEGRSHLTHTDKVYDLIQISLIDSWAASAAGAFALAENNLYTVEAFELYGQRLSERGLLSISRWNSELPRLVVLAHSALESIGIEDPRKHMLLVSAQEVATLLVSKTAFVRKDIQTLDAICEERGFVRFYPVLPGETAPNPFIAETVDGHLATIENMGLNVAPPTDDSPYFFHLISPFSDPDDLPADLSRVTGLGVNLDSSSVLRQAMFMVGGLSILLFLGPFVARVGRRQRKHSLVHTVRATLFFATIGCAFMLIENMLVQRFVLYLGHPSYATTVILASILLGMGVGSTYSERIGLGSLKRFGLVVPVLLVLLVSALPWLFSTTLGLGLFPRIAISCAVLMPLGALLGIFFPLGMLRFGDTSKPWYWAINGVFGVVASVMSLALSMEFGYTFVGMLSAALYVMAWACLFGRAEVVADG